jgi:membrane fusion protein, multidrug efflux system
MLSFFRRPSRIAAIVLAIAAVVWMGSRVVAPQAEERPSAQSEKATAPQVPVQRVSVIDAAAERHQQQTVLSCVTQADHRAQAVARGAGVIVDLKVKLGATVKAGDVIAIISDEGRQAAVRQAQALVDQRQAEYDANKRLIDQGSIPRNQLTALEAAVAASKAALASAQAEAARANVVAPIEGVINDLPMQVGQAVQVGSALATIVDPDPMLGVGAVSENRRAKIQVGQAASIRFINGSTASGTVSFVGLSADKATRTYPVQASIANPKAAIPDGVTCEMTVTIAPIMAVGVPRSALIFSDEGHLGVRIVGDREKAVFAPVDVVDDAIDTVWVTGLTGSIRIITVGQDFVRDGDPVVAVPASPALAKTGAPT